MKQITYTGITYDCDHVTETVELPNEMMFDDGYRLCYGTKWNYR